MPNGDLNWIAGFIWSIADDVLRDVYVRGKYRDVILPMTVVRRLDAVLEASKDAVLKLSQQLDDAGVANKQAALCQAAGNAFYNISPFTLRDLRARARQQQLKADFEAYLDGFSPNVQEILDKFKFRNQIPTLVEADILGSLIEKFTSSDIHLGPDPLFDQDGNVRFPGLDNHAMGTIFEELIRRFNEENNEEAGEHFTPRDVVRLMANLIFFPIAGDIKDAAYRVYDGACGTGGMLTVAEETLAQLAREHGKEVSIHLFGQEVQPDMSVGATMQSPNTGILRRLPLPLPTHDEQLRIPKFVERETAQVNEAITRVQQQIDLIREYRTRLITDVVTGKLDVRHLGQDMVGEFLETEAMDEGIDDEEWLGEEESELCEEAIE